MRRIIGLFCALILLTGVIFAVPVNAFAISGSQYVPSERNKVDSGSSGGENVDPSNYPNLTSEQIKSIVSDCEFKICDINKLLYEENKKAEQVKQDNSLLGRIKSFLSSAVNSIKTLIQKTAVVVKPFFKGLIRLDRDIYSFVSTPNKPVATNLPFPFNLIYKLLFGGENIQKPNNVAKVDLKVSETKNGEISKSEEVGSNATSLAGILTNKHNEKDLKKGYPVSSYNRFESDPYSFTIPEEAKAVYTWADDPPNTYPGGLNGDFTNCPRCYYNPGKYQEEYIECTAFVYMSYNMSEIRLPQGMGNATDWSNKKRKLKVDGKEKLAEEVFDIYTSGADSEPIKKGDMMVWDRECKINKEGKEKCDVGHVGVITKIFTEAKRFAVANANSDQAIHYYYWKEVNNKITILDGDGKEVKWRPDHWMRLKGTNNEKN